MKKLWESTWLRRLLIGIASITALGAWWCQLHEIDVREELFPTPAIAPRKLLDSLVSLDVQEKPFGEVLEQLGEQVEGTIEIDSKLLAVESIVKRPVSLRVQNISLESALALLVRRLNSDEISYRFLETYQHVLFTTSNVRGEPFGRLALHPLASLLTVPDNLELDELVDELVEEGSFRYLGDDWEAELGVGSREPGTILSRLTQPSEQNMAKLIQALAERSEHDWSPRVVGGAAEQRTAIIHTAFSQPITLELIDITPLAAITKLAEVSGQQIVVLDETLLKSVTPRSFSFQNQSLRSALETLFEPQRVSVQAECEVICIAGITQNPSVHGKLYPIGDLLSLPGIGREEIDDLARMCIVPWRFYPGIRCFGNSFVFFGPWDSHDQLDNLLNQFRHVAYADLGIALPSRKPTTLATAVLKTRITTGAAGWSWQELKEKLKAQHGVNIAARSDLTSFESSLNDLRVYADDEPLGWAILRSFGPPHASLFGDGNTLFIGDWAVDQPPAETDFRVVRRDWLTEEKDEQNHNGRPESFDNFLKLAVKTLHPSRAPVQLLVTPIGEQDIIHADWYSQDFAACFYDTTRSQIRYAESAQPAIVDPYFAQRQEDFVVHLKTPVTLRVEDEPLIPVLERILPPAVRPWRMDEMAELRLKKNSLQTVPCEWSEVPLWRVLQQLLEPHELTFTMEGNKLRLQDASHTIYPCITRLYSLKWLQSKHNVTPLAFANLVNRSSTFANQPEAFSYSFRDIVAVCAPLRIHLWLDEQIAAGAPSAPDDVRRSSDKTLELK